MPLLLSLLSLACIKPPSDSAFSDLGGDSEEETLPVVPDSGLEPGDSSQSADSWDAPRDTEDFELGRPVDSVDSAPATDTACAEGEDPREVEDRVGDGRDQNCDGVDGVDADGDGSASAESGGEDCDDGDPERYPGAADLAYDEIDQDCDSEDASFEIRWDDSLIELEVRGRAGGNFQVGVAEVNESCGDACWTGEDCLYGYPLESGEVLAWCHEFSGSMMSLSYGGDAGALAEGVDTVFPNSSYRGWVTWWIQDLDTGDCWVSGSETGYYAEVCTNEVSIEEI